eukprot:TRINITY_DN3557_c0_g1_i1.p1 TRINITY_DN3557_c0_g1~~TRINITY_DN3557_c0_g1_i1.p1  ORF type:complete len:552 (-),score=99.89 TRINITY_DN3557_c0_g1_i1:723-2252(-)
MMDAGSSGTRLHIYMWINQRGVPNIAEAPNIAGEVPWVKYVRPGISSFATNPENVASSLKPLTDWAATVIPSNKLSSTVIFLKATAGMRLLPSDIQTQILERVRDFLGSTPFKFERQWAVVMSGTAEGLFGWVTTNALLHRFAGDRNQTVGALDLGGASTQIVFETTERIVDGGTSLIFSDALRYNLYSHSFLGFGNDQASQKVILNLIQDIPAGSNVMHPCLPLGYNTTFTDASNQTWQLFGASSFSDCYNLAIAILGKDQPCVIPPCSFDGVYMPTIQQNRIFYGFNGFFFLTKFLNLSSNVDIETIKSATEEFCDMTWEEINVHHSGNNQFLQTYCFLGTWAVTLLHDGYGFNLNSTQVITHGEIDGVQLGWTYGAMLFEADLVEWEQMCSAYSDCGSCLQHVDTCGWCGSSGSCQPISYPCDVGWTSTACPGDNVSSNGNLTRRAIIALGSVGGAAVLLSIAIAFVMFYKKRQQSKRLTPLLYPDELDDEEASLVGIDENNQSWK